MRIAIRSSLRAVLVLAGLVGGFTVAARGQQGTITGRVTDQTSGHPLGGARITVVGTSLIAQTNADGRYTVARVPAGRTNARASAVGFGAVSHVVTVTVGDTAVRDFALALAPYSLGEVVVAITGEQAKKQVGHAI